MPMTEVVSKKRKLLKTEKVEIKDGEYSEIDDLVKTYQNDLKWCNDLKFFKIIKNDEWTGQICCSGECLKPEPIQVRQPNGRLKSFNLKRHMDTNHDPEKIKLFKEKRLTKLNAIPSYFRPAKSHSKEEKKEAAALLTAVAACNNVSINQMQRYSIFGIKT